MNLSEFFCQHKKIALAFSGGVDSAYLLYAAKTFGVDVTAYMVKSCFQPEFELKDARRLADELNAKLIVLPMDILSDEKVVANPADRCFYCKEHVFTHIIETAKKDGYSCICDGTNGSDKGADRPGMKVLTQMNILSPLRLCGMTKADIRKKSKEAGLFTWDKPAYACLATRIPTGYAVKAADLMRIEASEGEMMNLGYENFRVRLLDDKTAKIEMSREEMEKAFTHRKDIVSVVGKYFDHIYLDLEER